MPPSIHQNLIVSGLPETERLRVVRLMEPVDLPLRTVLTGNRGDAGSVYFPTSGLVSVVASMSDGAAVECGAVGMEGWIGDSMFAGLLPPGLLAFQQIPGTALRMSGGAFETALSESAAFAAAVARFSGVLLSFAMQTAACNRLHDALARCARWLLFTHARVASVELAITHEFLAQMLGASRSAVTSTMTRLEQASLIERARGHVLLRDVPGLQAIACECHDALMDTYSRYLVTLRA
jgi:CRP-like cAMP-binding protein